jgi:hypothetical protein
LSDDEMSGLAGGFREDGTADGREIQVGGHHLVAGIGSRWFSEICRACGTEGSLFAKSHSSDGSDFFDCKCYNCGKQWPKISIQSVGAVKAVGGPGSTVGNLVRP